jgi:CheY-like chemotaxis protein
MTKILLVEDDKSLREIYGVRLMAEGYTVVSAGDGEEALALAIKERPDLIVSDVMMPKISGFDMLDILRSTTETKDIKVIMMTALSSEDQRARGESLGADRYLVKSQVGIEDVVRTVHEVLGDGLPGSVPAEAPMAPAVAIPVISMPAPVETPAALSTPALMTPEFPPMPVPIVAPVPVSAPAPIEPPVTPIVSEVPELIIPDAPAPLEPLAPPAQDVAVAPMPLAPAPTLPAPTAPFSSNPPASLGDRIINPLPSADALSSTGTADIASQMNQELGAQMQNQPAPEQYAPAPVPSTMAPVDPQPIQQPQPVQTMQQLPPQPMAMPPQPQVPPLPPQPGI